MKVKPVSGINERKVDMNKKMLLKLLALLVAFSLILSSYSLHVLATESNSEDAQEAVTEELDSSVVIAPDVEEGEVVASRRPILPHSETIVEVSDSDGVYSHRNWYPDITYDDLLGARQTPFARFAAGEPHHFDATRSLGTPGVATHGNMSIERVAVMYGGQYQARYRGQAGHGYLVYQGASGDWYTTSKTATLMDGRVFTIHTHLPPGALGGATPQAFLDSLEYTYGNLPFTSWLGGNMFNNAAARFIHWAGDDLIAHGDGSFTLESFIEFRSPYGQSAPTAINAPFPGYRGVNQAGFAAAMRHVIGVFDLSIHSNLGGGVHLGSLPINLNLYDDFHLWGQVDSWARGLQAEAGAGQTINNRYVRVTTLGQSHGGEEIWNIVIAESAAAVHDYFEYTRPRMTSNLDDLLTLREEIEEGVHHRIPIYFHNIHPDEVTGVCAQLIMVEQLLREDYLTFETVREEQTFGLRTGALWGTPTPHPEGYVSVGRGPLTDRNDTTTVTISVEEALHYFIFIFVPTNNPDGHNGMLRSNMYGFDLNRDASYQTQIENVLIVEDVLRWNPLAMLEFHGHVAHLLIEPTTGPHNPNYEYDLLHPPMLEAAHVMGRAAISGAYNRYLIPAEHMTDGWDDGGPMYMPIFLMHFGILGFTLEIPHTNQDSLDANIAMGWSFVDHAMDNFDDLFLNKLEHNRRGMTNADYADLVDPFFRNPFTTPPTPIGRPRQEGRSFFPDYWVIPMDTFNQRNTLEAYNMLEKLERHGISIERTIRRVVHGDYIFPGGTYVVDMRQARRGYVNTMLEAGYNASFFTAMYAEITMNFPHLRGFNAVAIWEEDLFDGVTVPVSGVSVPDTTLPPGDSPYVVVSNNNQDAIRLINDLLREGVNVQLLTVYAEEGRGGDFVVPRQALTESRLEGRFVETTALDSIPTTAQQLVQPNVAVLTAPRPVTQGLFSPAPFIMRDLGFDYTWVTSNANLGALLPGVDFNIITSHNQNFANAWSISNTHEIPVIAVQTTAATNAVSNLFGGRGAASNNITGSREGTFRASYSPTSMITAHYDRANAAYLIGATTFSRIPTGTVPLVRIADGVFEDVFLGGWWQGAANQANVPGRVTAFTGLTNANVPATVFGSNIFNRAHLQGYHNMFATAAFMHVAGIEEPGRPFARVAETTDAPNDRMLVTLEFVASEVEGSTATVGRRLFKVTNTPTVPTLNTATAVADGWLPYIGPIEINPAEEFIHWFVQNSHNVMGQGSINLGVIPAGIHVPVLSFDIFNNGEGGSPGRPNINLGNIIRMWTQLDGVNTPVPYADLTVTARLPNGDCAMEFIRINRPWVAQDTVNFIDADKNGDWQRIYLTATLNGQSVDVILVNRFYVPLVLSFDIFNNGPVEQGATPSRPNAGLAAAGTIRMWTQINGVNTPVQFADLTVTAQLPNGDCAMRFVTIHRPWVNQNTVNFIDVNKNGPWERIYLTATLSGRRADVVLVNSLYVPTVFSFDIFNNGQGGSPSRPNAGLGSIIRMWTQINGVNTPVLYADLTVTARLPNGDCAMNFVRINRPWANQDTVNHIDVNRNPGWERIYLTATVSGRSVDVVLVN